MCNLQRGVMSAIMYNNNYTSTSHHGDRTIHPPAYYNPSVQQHYNDDRQKYPVYQEECLVAAPVTAARVDTRDSIPASVNDDEFIDEATAFSRRQPTQRASRKTLEKPVLVPQIIPGLGQPFARVYAPALAAHDIQEVEFLEFVDNLNVVATASPPLQIVGLVGGVLGLVPLHTVQLASMGVQALAKLGTAAVSKGRTELYMRKVNREFFQPRRLKVSIVTWDVMVYKLKIPATEQTLSAITPENMHEGLVERRVRNLQPFIAELRFDVAAPTTHSTMLAKISARQVNRQIQKSEKKTMQAREKQISEKGKLAKEMRKLDKETEKAQRKAEKERSKHGGKDAAKADRELEKELRKIEKDRSKELGKADKETKQAKKALWICIEDL